MLSFTHMHTVFFNVLLSKSTLDVQALAISSSCKIKSGSERWLQAMCFALHRHHIQTSCTQMQRQNPRKQKNIENQSLKVIWYNFHLISKRHRAWATLVLGASFFKTLSDQRLFSNLQRKSKQKLPPSSQTYKIKHDYLAAAPVIPVSMHGKRLLSNSQLYFIIVWHCWETWWDTTVIEYLPLNRKILLSKATSAGWTQVTYEIRYKRILNL